MTREVYSYAKIVYIILDENKKNSDKKDAPEELWIEAG